MIKGDNNDANDKHEYNDNSDDAHYTLIKIMDNNSCLLEHIRDMIQGCIPLD